MSDSENERAERFREAHRLVLQAAIASADGQDRQALDALALLRVKIGVLVGDIRRARAKGKANVKA